MPKKPTMQQLISRALGSEHIPRCTKCRAPLYQCGTCKATFCINCQDWSWLSGKLQCYRCTGPQSNPAWHPLDSHIEAHNTPQTPPRPPEPGPPKPGPTPVPPKPTSPRT